MKITKEIALAFDKKWQDTPVYADPWVRAHASLEAALPATYIEAMRIIADSLGSGDDAPTTLWEIAKEFERLASELTKELYGD